MFVEILLQNILPGQGEAINTQVPLPNAICLFVKIPSPAMECHEVFCMVQQCCCLGLPVNHPVFSLCALWGMEGSKSRLFQGSEIDEFCDTYLSKIPWLFTPLEFIPCSSTRDQILDSHGCLVAILECVTKGLCCFVCLFSVCCCFGKGWGCVHKYPLEAAILEALLPSNNVFAE